MKTMLKVLAAVCMLAVNTVASAQGWYNEFGLKLLARARQEEPGKNVFLSPAGLALALSMAANGAQGATARQMLSALQFTGPAADLNAANADLLKHLTGLNKKTKLEIANSLWLAEDAKIKAGFIDSARTFYGASASNVNFNNPATADEINAWVSKHTHGKIPKMVQPPLGANRLILLDAIYFKGDWIAPFDKKLTRDQPFTLANGQTITAPRMSRTGEIDYLENETFQAVRLPYAGRQISMCVFLPKKSLDDFIHDASFQNWSVWMRQFMSRKGTLEMPRFKLENEYKLNGILKSLGMTKAFTRQADFRGISDEPLYIDWIRQKTYVDVNEEGTEAAAVTGIGFRALAVRREEPPFRMIVDRPFFLAICDAQSGVILFGGAIVDPRS